MELQARNIISYFIKTSDNKHDYTFKITSEQIIIYYKNTEIYYYNFSIKESLNRLTKILKGFNTDNAYYTRPMLETQYKRIYSFFKQVNLNKVIKKSYRFRFKNKNMQKYMYEYYCDKYEIIRYDLRYYKYKIYIRNTIHYTKRYLLFINLFFD